MHLKSLIYLFLLTSLFNTSCSSENSPSGSTNRYPEAETQNIDPEGLENAYDVISGLANSKWLLVERNGVIVMEEYFNGYTSESYDNIWSDTKSITSILMGIAIDQGYIQSVNQPISDFVGDLAPNLDPEKGAITLRNFLTMTSGLPWNELAQSGISTSSDFPTWRNSDNQVQWVLNQSLIYTPGEYWNYNTGGSHLLCVIVAQATGMNVKDFANQYLFGPLDIQIGDWPQDKQGNYYGSHGLNLKASDMLKIGELYLHNGMYNGNQIVSSAWVTESTRYIYPVFNIENNSYGYGYQWWVNRHNGRNFFYADGYGGQMIMVFPAEDLIIVSAAAAELDDPNTANYNSGIISRAIYNYILPAVGH